MAFFIILLALSWWYSSAKFYGDNGCLEDWSLALADVKWVQDQMKVSFNSGKRSRDETENDVDAQAAKR